jgi:hypothetical protein
LPGDIKPWSFTMDKTLLAEWESLHANHVAAHQEYLRVQEDLNSRMREAAHGRQRAYPVNDDLDAHVAAASGLEKARLAMHEFCRQHAEYC